MNWMGSSAVRLRTRAELPKNFSGTGALELPGNADRLGPQRVKYRPKLQADNNSLSQSPQIRIDGQTVGGLIAGVVQVNVRTPNDAKSGPATLDVGVGGNYGSWRDPCNTLRVIRFSFGRIDKLHATRWKQRADTGADQRACASDYRAAESARDAGTKLALVTAPRSTCADGEASSKSDQCSDGGLPASSRAGRCKVCLNEQTTLLWSHETGEEAR